MDATGCTCYTMFMPDAFSNPPISVVADRIETLGRSTVQHGPLNDRVYLMQLDRGDLPGILDDLDRLARRNGYGKIGVKVPAGAAPFFEKNGYHVEARIPGFFGPAQDGFYQARFPRPERGREGHPEAVASALAMLDTVAPASPRRPPPRGVMHCRPPDAQAMSALYRRVFASYPFPVFDPNYLAGAMAGDVAYFGIRRQDRLVALASAEIDHRHRAAEMTDFAVLPGWRGRQLAGRLLAVMETELARRGLATAFSIARLRAPAMSVVFKRAGYILRGCLVNNTHIGGTIETMAVWSKSLSK